MPFALSPLATLARAIGIKGGIIIALLIALGIVVWRADGLSEQREALRNTLATERAQHAVTRTSLDTLQRELERMVKDGEIRAQRLSEAREAQAKRTAGLREEAARIRAEGGSEGACETPDAVREARGL